MIYITGDTHGDFVRYFDFVEKNKPTENDVMIVLGDAGLNYYGDDRDADRKRFVNDFPFVTFCIHGNHEMRPFDIPSYKTKMFCDGMKKNILIFYLLKMEKYINSVSFHALSLAALIALINIIAFLVGGTGLKTSNPPMK